MGTKFLVSCLYFERDLFLSGSLMAQPVENLPEMQETWVQFLGQDDPLEKEMATQFSILAWEIPCIELH